MSLVEVPKVPNSQGFFCNLNCYMTRNVACNAIPWIDCITSRVTWLVAVQCTAWRKISFGPLSDEYSNTIMNEVMSPDFEYSITHLKWPVELIQRFEFTHVRSGAGRLDGMPQITRIGGAVSSGIG